MIEVLDSEGIAFFMEMCKGTAMNIISQNERDGIPVEKWDFEDWEQVCRGAGLEAEFDECLTDESMIELTKKACTILLSGVVSVYPEQSQAAEPKRVRPKRKTHTSSEVKNRYNKKAYDRFYVTMKKGEKDALKAVASERGFKSLNAYILHCIKTEQQAHESGIEFAENAVFF